MKGDRVKPCKDSLMRDIISTGDMIHPWLKKKENHPYPKRESRRYRRQQIKLSINKLKKEEDHA